MIGMITELIDNPEKRAAFGKAGRQIIEASFSLDRMGKAFEQTYEEVISKKSELGNKKFEIGGRKYEVGNRNYEV
jgi:hypothetical protein